MKEPFLYKILRPIIKFLFLTFYRPTILGKENILKEGRLILAGNHTNYFDCALLISSTNRCIHFLAKKSLSKGIKGLLFKNMGMIFVDRAKHDKKVIIESEGVLVQDGLIGIFPEGTINRGNNYLLDFKIGAVKMAYDTNSKITPFVIMGDYKFLGKNLKIIFLKPYNLKSDDLDQENEVLRNKIEKELKKHDKN